MSLDYSVIRNFLLSLCFIIVGCSSAPTVSPKFDSYKIRTIALLPTTTTDEISRERVQAIEKSILISLQNSGYLVLDPALTNKFCTTSNCDKATLARKHLVDAFFQLSLDSAAKRSFLAGYYYTISGNLKLFDKSGTTLVDVPHTQREGGGLLFQTGQVLQGLKETLNDFDGSSFNALGERFAQDIVEKLPPINKQRQDIQPPSVSLVSVSTRPLSPGVYEICAKGTSSMLAYLVVGPSKSNLRESSLGNYCGVYRLDNLPKAPSVEITSPFGTAIRQDLTGVAGSQCSRITTAELSSSSSTPVIRTSCQNTDGSCATDCRPSKVIVYQANSELGPYVRLVETSNTQVPVSKSVPYLSAASIDNRGVPSLPVVVTQPLKLQ